MRALGIALLVSVFAGCASSGPVIEDAQLAGLHTGKTTREEVLRRFGRPSFDSDNLDGTRTSAYLQPGNSSEAGAMVSLIAALAGGATPGVNSVILRFDDKGRLSGYQRTRATASGTASGITWNPVAAGGGAGAGSGTAPVAAQAAKPAPAAQTAPPPAKPARSDGLPGWLPSSSTRDPNHLH